MNTFGTLPAWSNAGVLPPIWPGESGNSPLRSPYKVSLSSFIQQFSTSPERIAIMEGLLKFRERLHKLGLVSGFQWLNGSFLEQVEILKERPPRDIDVVTFFQMPKGNTQATLFEKNKKFFDPEFLESQYSVDSYFMELGKASDENLVKQVAYWYSMWSHRRSGLWKGFVQIDLSPAEDDRARNLLTNMEGTKNE